MIRVVMVMCCLLAGLVAAEDGSRESGRDVLAGLPMYRLEAGKPVPYGPGEATTHVAFYFSASWCPPCRKTTPALVAEYARMKSVAGMVVELVLVGDDASEQEMLAYMRKYGIEWPAVVFAERGRVEKYAADGIPHLVLVERGTGQVISYGTGVQGVEAVVARMRDFSGVETKESFQVEGLASRYGVLVAVLLSVAVIFALRKRAGLTR